MRCFIAIDIPEEIKDKISEIQNNFKDFDIKFVEKENFHFNLKFLGEVPDSSVEEIKNILENVIDKFEPFELDIKNLGIFPSLNYIRVIWIGIGEGHNILSTIANEIDNSLADIVPRENRKFEPHLTIGRVRSGRNREELVKIVNKLEKIEIGKMKVNEIKLMKSELSREGPVYTTISSIAL
jgi:2'-5' RNA ligase